MHSQTIGQRPEIRRGDYRRVLADLEEIDLLVLDTPYSEKTHKGHRARRGNDNANRSDIGYAPWNRLRVVQCVKWAQTRVRGWVVCITDHELGPVWHAQMQKAGWYTFAPIPWVSPGGTVRMRGDGPSSWTCWIYVARPRTKEFANWGTLPGAYIIASDARRRGGSKGMQGVKPLALMRAIVRDYSRPGDLVVDPTAGSGTTLLAAAIEGRRAVGAEIDKRTHDNAQRRLAIGYTPTFNFRGSRLATQTEIAL